MSKLDLPSSEELRDWSRQRTAELEKRIARQQEEIQELRQANYDLRAELEAARAMVEWEQVPDGVYTNPNGEDTSIKILSRPDGLVDIALSWCGTRLWSVLPADWILMRRTQQTEVSDG